LEVAVAVAENRWPDLPGNLQGSVSSSNHLKTKEISIINHILTPISDDIQLPKYNS
jgi:hypothetical protein